MMASTDHIPLMKPGNTRRNILIGIGYLVFLPIVLLILPFWLLYAIGTNRNGFGDAITASPIGWLPGVNEAGWKAGTVMFIFTLVLLAFLSAAVPGADDPDDQAAIDNGDFVEDTPIPEELDETPTPEEAGGFNNDTPTPEDNDTLIEIQELYSITLDELGLTTTVSEAGEYIGYGLDNGNVVLVDKNGTTDELRFQANQRVTHLIISEEQNQFALAWMDMHTFGGDTMDRDDSWAYEFFGLWDIAATSDMESVAAVSAPFEEDGAVGLVVDGEDRWTEMMDNATGIAVDITDSGSDIVVGADFTWTGGDRDGTPGVYYYNDDGDLEWVHETDEAVLSVGIDEDEELVVAGTDDQKILAFDMDGELLWENEEGGYIELSPDGSTIISDAFGDVIAFDSEGEELWRESAPTFGEDLDVSENGSRVIVGSRGDGVATVIDDGEVIWNESWDDGPIQVSISDDGRTWSVIVMDTDDEVSHIYAYRDP